MKKDIFAAYRLPYVGAVLAQEAKEAGVPFTPVVPVATTTRVIFQPQRAPAFWNNLSKEQAIEFWKGGR